MACYFYPRSPCGERRFGPGVGGAQQGISIHALLAESDGVTVLGIQHRVGISIHALLAESDFLNIFKLVPASYFYPRSPCGERRVTVLGIQHRVGISIHALLAESDHPKTSSRPRNTNFYPRSPCGERLSKTVPGG